ncbi:MAG TPA: DUF533 domain-containing protein [Microvirga sp.]|jgi:uncharacterized membrane protein YebE (DUF533 family)|nr:DUF533 domain-containing protein [Microvirga sp.]
MVNAKSLLDALVSASARPGGLAGAIGDVINQATSGLQDATQKAGQAPSVGQKVDQTIGQVASGVASGQKPGDLVSKAKQVMADNPGLAEAAMIGLAGLLFGSRKNRGVQPSFAKLGGLALVGGLAYKAYENYRAGQPLIDMSGQGASAGGQGGSSSGGSASAQAGSSPSGGVSSGQGDVGRAAGGQSTGSSAAGTSSAGQPSGGPAGGAGGSSAQAGGSKASTGTSSGQTGASTGSTGASSGGAQASSSATGAQRPASGGAVLSSPFQLDPPQSSGFHPISHTEDDALLFLRAMVAAASADGQIDEAERSRITKGLVSAGVDEESTRWLEREMASPADVEELSAGVKTPEKAAQIYTAARLVVDPDTIQEREFLRRLAESLDLDEALRSQIDSTAVALKST